MAAFPWSSFPTITTARVALREIRRSDAPDIFRFRSDQEVQRYNTRPMRAVVEAQALVSTMQYWYRHGQAIQWGITVRPVDRVVGICGLHDWRPDQRRAMLGYDLAREHWGRGLAFEAMRAVLAFGFKQLGAARVEAITVAENARSVRLLERLGFLREADPADAAAAPRGDPWAEASLERQTVTYALSRDRYEAQRPADGGSPTAGPPTADPPTAPPAP